MRMRSRGRREIRKRLGRRSGFSLIELSLVLFLMALMTIVVAFSVASAKDRVFAESLLGRIEHFDWRVRTRAQRSGRSETLEIDAAAGELRIVTDGADAATRDGLTLEIPASWRIAGLRETSSQTANGTRSRRSELRTLRLRVDPSGTTKTYAIALASKGGDVHWTVFSGITGQRSTYERTSDVDDLFRTLERPHSR